MRQANEKRFDPIHCLNHRLPTADLLEANCGRLWNKGRTVCEIAKALHLSPYVVTNILPACGEQIRICFGGRVKHP